MDATFGYCLKNNLLGVGWRAPSLRNTNNWDEYFLAASENLAKICSSVSTSKGG